MVHLAQIRLKREEPFAHDEGNITDLRRTAVARLDKRQMAKGPAPASLLIACHGDKVPKEISRTKVQAAADHLSLDGAGVAGGNERPACQGSVPVTCDTEASD